MKNKFLRLCVTCTYTSINVFEIYSINILVFNGKKVLLALYFVANGRYEYCYNESWILTEFDYLPCLFV